MVLTPFFCTDPVISLATISAPRALLNTILNVLFISGPRFPSDEGRCNTELRPRFDSNSDMRQTYPPPRGLSKNECTDFQHARSNISVCASEYPENRDFRELSRNYERVSQKQHFEKTARGVPRKTVAVSIAFYGKLRRKNEIPRAK